MAKAKQPAESVEPVQSAGAAAATQTGLNVQDLTTVLQIINIASTRGAFRADELATVGGVHDRILAFLESVGAVSKTPANDDGTVQEPSKPN